MKKILFALLNLIVLNINSQILPYSWYPGNPGWISNNPTINTLSYQSGCYKFVSTSDCNGGGSWYTYNNSQITTYTSPSYSFTCSSPSVTLTFTLDVNLENKYDWLYFQYYNNLTSSWINPVSTSMSTNSSNINLSTYAPLMTPAPNNNRNGWTGGLGNIIFSYSVPKNTQFRFIFESDGSVNTYNGGSSIYYADILGFNITCPSVLPIELIEFTGYYSNFNNIISWKTATEINNDYYIIERSIDAINWSEIKKVKGSLNSTNQLNYNIIDDTYFNTINYYRLTQYNIDKSFKSFDIIYIDNSSLDNYIKVIKIVNILGQEVDMNYEGLRLIYYSNGKVIKTY
jgi:hypothetical protein